MAAFLIVYGTTYGQTGKIMSRIAERLEDLGHEVTLWNADALPRPHPLDRFDAVVVAGSVRYGKFQRSIGDFVRWNLARLEAVPSAFVSVCGAARDGTREGETEARRYVDGFRRETGWVPTLSRSFAGAVRYTEYGFVTRWIMRLVNWRTGGPTDTSRDWEFTDWDAVAEFAQELVGLLPRSAVTRAATSAPVPTSS